MDDIVIKSLRIVVVRVLTVFITLLICFLVVGYYSNLCEVKVVNGEGGGFYNRGDFVQLSPELKEHKDFVKWCGDVEWLTFPDMNHPLLMVPKEGDKLSFRALYRRKMVYLPNINIQKVSLGEAFTIRYDFHDMIEPPFKLFLEYHEGNRVRKKQLDLNDGLYFLKRNWGIKNGTQIRVIVSGRNCFGKFLDIIVAVIELKKEN